MWHTPIVIRATRALFQRFDDEIYPWNRGRHVRLMPIGASAHPMVAFGGFYESHGPPPLDDVHGIVLAHHHGHRNGQQSGHISHSRFVWCCRPGGRRGDMEWVVVWWRHLLAFMKALDLVHPAMNAILHHHTAMAVQMACDEGAFVHCHRLFCLA